MVMVFPARMQVVATGLLLLLSLLVVEKASSQEQSGQLTAAEIDDNLNFESYLLYQETAHKQINSQYLPYPNLSGRVVVQVVDESGQAARGTAVQFSNTELPVGTNGKISLFPNEYDDLSAGIQAKPVGGTCPQDCSTVQTTSGSANTTTKAAVDGAATSETLELQIPASTTAAPTMLDLALIVDTTGSMCDEMDYLKAEMKDVIQRVVSASAQDGTSSGGVDVRVAYVAYKDTGDSYVVQAQGFTTPDLALEAFESELCTGGGDFPEAMEQALVQASTALQWRTSGSTVRVALVVADAPPHDENMPEALQAALRLRELGVRVYGLAASSAAEKAEYMMRLMAILTGAWHMWLTDDSGIGNAHATPTVPCYKVQYLNALLVRVLTTELTGERVEAAAEGVIREEGQQEKGVCLVGLTPAPTPSPVDATSAPGPASSPSGSDGVGDDAATTSDGGESSRGADDGGTSVGTAVGDAGATESGGMSGSPQACFGVWSIGPLLIAFLAASLW